MKLLERKQPMKTYANQVNQTNENKAKQKRFAKRNANACFYPNIN